MQRHLVGFKLNSFAKINWKLLVIGRRDDGFHELFTLFQSISLHDTLHFAEGETIELTCDDPEIPTDDRNLIVRAANALADVSGTALGGRIRLEKRIPSPGGLGGGSSNAALALIGLNRLWKLGLDPDRLVEIACRLGSDVPFFLTGGTAVGTGRGEKTEVIEDITAENMLVVTPDIAVSTAEAFGRLEAATLTSEGQNRILSVSRKEADRLDPRLSELRNDLEPSVFAAHPEIRRVKDTLLALGAVNAAMSGSGASVFAIFDNKETRQAAQKALETESTWRKFAVSTISRDQYREALDL